MFFPSESSEIHGKEPRRLPQSEKRPAEDPESHQVRGREEKGIRGHQQGPGDPGKVSRTKSGSFRFPEFFLN